MARRGSLVGSIAFAIFVVIAVGLNAFAQVVSAGQNGDGDSVGSHAIDAAVGATFAVCGAIARRLGARRAGWLMIIGATTWTFGTFANGLIMTSAWSVPFVALESTLAIVIAILALSYPNLGIASRLVVSPKTVESHVASIFTKLDIEAVPEEHRRVLAVLRLLRAGE